MTEYEIKKSIVEVGKMMSDRGLVGTYEGNISVKCGDRIYVTPSGQSKELLTEGKIITVDTDGNKLEGCLTPTSETPMHTAVYRMRPDVGAVVHCHAPFCTAYALANMPIESKSSPEFMILFGDVPVVPYGTPGTDDIYNGMEELLKTHDVVLLANHGMLAVGKDAMEAFSKTASLEMLVKTMVISKLIAGDKNTDLPAEERAKLNKMGENKRGMQPQK